MHISINENKDYDAKHKGIISKHLEFIRFNEPVYKLDSTKSHKCGNYKSNCTANPYQYVLKLCP